MPAEPQGRRLDSWKEIAAYLGRDQRTVIRWEQERGLPVHRMPGGKRAAVFAYSGELDAWLVNQPGAPAQNPGASVDPFASPNSGRRMRTFAVAALLTAAVGVAAWQAWSRFAPDGPAELPRETRLEGPGFSVVYERSTIDPGMLVYRLAVGDLNEDGVLDFVATTAPGDVVVVLIGNGDATFQPARILEKCPQSDNLVLADFNRDGHLDIAAACMLGDTVAVFWGRGDGSFPRRTDIPVPGGPRFLAAADADGDGWPDLAVGAFGKGELYFVRNRRGEFHPFLLAPVSVTGPSTFLDLDSDGKLDLLVGTHAAGKDGISVFQGNGDGTFHSSEFRPWTENEVRGSSATLLFIAPYDFDQDGRTDLLLNTWNLDVRILWGLGSGRFSPPQSLSTGVGSFTSEVADLDRDGKPDVLTTDSQKGVLRFFRNNGDRTFSAARELPVGAYPIAPVVADFNGDGLPDIALRTAFTPSITILKAIGSKPAQTRPPAR